MTVISVIVGSTRQGRFSLVRARGAELGVRTVAVRGLQSTVAL